MLKGDLNMSMQNNSFDKNQLIQKQKRSWLIATIVIAICCAAMLVGVIVCFASKESGLAIFSLFFNSNKNLQEIDLRGRSFSKLDVQILLNQLKDSV